MEALQTYYNNILRHISLQFKRELYGSIQWEQRMIAIRGPRGAGKTTLMLQHLAGALSAEKEKTLYITADFHWFYTHTLYETAEGFYQNGGRYLYIDEVHKYPNWSRELKNIYDGFPDMRVVFSSSSALEIYRGEADLSRRVMTYELPGLSFREYLIFTGHGPFSKITFDEILNGHGAATTEITQGLHPLPLFQKYLRIGYLPIVGEVPEEEVHLRLGQIINTVLETDLTYIEKYNASTAYKVKRLLGLLADSAPFKPNIAALSRKLDVSRDSVYAWFTHLEQARLLNLLHASGKGSSLLQKPDKVYLENTNLSFALKGNPDIGSVRETFLLTHLVNGANDVSMPKQGDFLVNGQTTLEVGGKNKEGSQLKNLTDAYLAIDGIEHGFGQKIPLWLFGFLY